MRTFRRDYSFTSETGIYHCTRTHEAKHKKVNNLSLARSKERRSLLRKNSTSRSVTTQFLKGYLKRDPPLSLTCSVISFFIKIQLFSHHRKLRLFFYFFFYFFFSVETKSTHFYSYTKSILFSLSLCLSVCVCFLCPRLPRLPRDCIIRTLFAQI